MRYKKGSMEISMSWVFMIIVGTFFVVFSYNVIHKYYENEEAKFLVELNNNLRNIMNNVGRTAGIEENSLEPLGSIFQDSRVKIMCNDNMPILSINDNLDTNNQYLNNYPTFMTYIEQEKIDYTYLAVESFRVPFKTTNTLAFVSKKNLIVFDKESEISKKLVKKFKDSSYSDLSYMVVNFDSLSTMENIKNDNLNSVIFVSDETRNMYGANLQDYDFEAYHVKINENTNNYGTIKYIDKDSNTKTFKYIDFDESLNMITMAIFSSPETFECSYNLMVESMEPIFDYYILKNNYLINKSQTHRVCSASQVSTNGPTGFDGTMQTMLYQNLKDSLIDAKNHVKNNGLDNPSTLYSLAKNIEGKQKELEEWNCIFVY